ncbi:hypothetical protein FOL47_009579 [Perkinsus chesapeaki]|uniref:Uncharacterized protein n=1 Tax=Perkinsus chesapeaki TaxID=330153 RepID=A0A7J6MRH9_PERCH|nr:hypothetical protein FOL47_009579 [Perkinsus chesapeaki]
MRYIEALRVCIIAVLLLAEPVGGCRGGDGGHGGDGGEYSVVVWPAKEVPMVPPVATGGVPMVLPVATGEVPMVLPVATGEVPMVLPVATGEVPMVLLAAKMMIVPCRSLEALAAFITVVWDIVLIIAARKDEGDEVVKSCEHFLAHAPWAETAAFILTRGFSLLVPQLAVLYVFYWVNRRLHASFRYNWDIDLSMGDTVCLPPAPTPFAAGSAGEPSFGFDEKTAQPYSGRQSDTHLPPVE